MYHLHHLPPALIGLISIAAKKISPKKSYLDLPISRCTPRDRKSSPKHAIEFLHSALSPVKSITMAPSRTKTMKNKHAAPKGGSSKGSGGGGGGGGDGGRRSDSGGISKPKKSSKGSGGPVSKQVKDKSVSALFKKKKARTYTEAELGIPTLNMVTPVGVEKPRGKKKGKVFVDDQVTLTKLEKKKAFILIIIFNNYRTA